MLSRGRTVVAALSCLALVAGCGSSTDKAPPGTSSRATTSIASVAAPPMTTMPPTTPAPRTTTAPATTATPSPSATTTAAVPKRKTTAARLPLDLRTGDATQVITVVSSSGGDTTATVQRWSKHGSGWRKVGSAVDAYVGSNGIGRASESTSKTPAGSFTLTQAFGRDADPGTRLPYVQTTSDDYWISSPGPKYNTRQRCGSCGYDNGVNERLREVTPEYDHAVVIDYNTRNAPGGVRPGRGSAFFLHIEHGEPTAGCVAIPRSALVDVLRWLRPADDPRILIGVD